MMHDYLFSLPLCSLYQLASWFSWAVPASQRKFETWFLLLPVRSPEHVSSHVTFFFALPSCLPPSELLLAPACWSSGDWSESCRRDDMAAAKAWDFSRSSFLLSRTSSWVRENSPSVLEWKMQTDRKLLLKSEALQRFISVLMVQKKASKLWQHW